MRLSPTSLCDRLRSGLVFSLIAVVLYLSGSGIAYGQLNQGQQTAVNNLQQTSAALKDRVAQGNAYAVGLSSAAQQGTIVDPAAHKPALLTDDQRNAYNSALSSFQATTFSPAAAFFADQAALSRTNMQTAISSLADATIELQRVAAVHQTVTTITDVPTARAAQQVIANAGLGGEVTSAHMAAYNASLSSVNAYATLTAAFMRAANNEYLTTNLDRFSQQYAKPLAYAEASFSYANSHIQVIWVDQVFSQNALLQQYQQSAENFQASMRSK